MGIWKWIAGLGAVGAAGAAAEYGIAGYFFNRTMVRLNATRERTTEMAGTDWEAHIPNIRACREWMDQQHGEEITVMSEDGLKLVGTYLPKAGSKRTVLCFHGYTSDGANDFPCLAKFYHEAGYHVLLVDERAHGRSEGTYIGFGCLDRFDVLSWCRKLIEKFGPDQEFILHGISMGGATVLMASGLNLPPQVKGIISDCAFTSAWDVFTSVLHTMYHLPAFPIMQISDWMARKKAGYSLAECNAAREVRKAGVPILLIHGDADTFVPCRMCYEIYENCASDASLLIVKGASHAESYHKDIPAYEGAVTELLHRAMGGSHEGTISGIQKRGGLTE